MRLDVKTDLSSYEIIIERGQYRRIGSIIRNNLGKRVDDVRKIFIITDGLVDSLYGDLTEEGLVKEGFEVFRYVINPRNKITNELKGESTLKVNRNLNTDGLSRIGESGNNEEYKNMETVMDIYSNLVGFNMKRSDLIIALGGGVVGDISGFVASTYLRGIGYIQIPTTLLSQVDSSVGGKTGIDIGGGKNLVGSFYNPLLVIIDPLYLKTLDIREYTSGMAEVIKYALISEPDLIEKIEDLFIDRGLLDDSNIDSNDLEIDDGMLRYEPEINDGMLRYDVLEEVIFRCCSIKKDVVEQDQFDTGKRMILNFGHTIGHALEARYGYKRYLHGEAVAIGMYSITSRLIQKGYSVDGKILDLLKYLLDGFCLGYSYDCDDGELIGYILSDKKNIADKFRVVMVARLGEASVIEVDRSFFE